MKLFNLVIGFLIFFYCMAKAQSGLPTSETTQNPNSQGTETPVPTQNIDSSQSGVNPEKNNNTNQANNSSLISDDSNPKVKEKKIDGEIDMTRLSKEERLALSREKDPFMIPNHLYIRLKRIEGDTKGEGYVDENAPPQVRWALKHYKLVGVIWNVKQPKAIISISQDQGKTYLYKEKDKIANNEGYIKKIQFGEVIIQEKDEEVKVKMNSAKDSKATK